MNRLDLVVGPNGAGKSTFVELTLSHLLPGSVFVNADEIARQRWPDDPASHAYEAARIAAATRAALIEPEAVLHRRDRVLASLQARARRRREGRGLHGRPARADDPGGPRRRTSPPPRQCGWARRAPEKIRERHRRLWPLVAEAVPRCDGVTVYDGSGRRGPRIVAQISGGDARRLAVLADVGAAALTSRWPARGPVRR